MNIETCFHYRFVGAFWACMLAASAFPRAQAGGGAMDPGWPRLVVSQGMTNTLYQPQLDSWDGQQLVAHAAVALQSAETPQPVFGVVSMAARTVVDKVQRVVQLHDLQLTSARFPAIPEKVEVILAQLRTSAPRQIEVISLDRLEASLALLQQERATPRLPLKNEPPAICFSESPALLITLDGVPVFQPLSGTGLQRVINTRVFLVRDASSGSYFLHFFDGYLTAPSLTGPWTPATQIAKEVKLAEKKAVEAKAVDLLSGQPDPETKKLPTLGRTPVPKLVFATKPTELIVFAGEPQWTSIPGTELLYASNTTGNVFVHVAESRNYVLISGRWFRSPSLHGPWEYVMGSSLPDDFARIPDASPKENVKASVPNTRQAQEAVIANSIPQTFQINRQATRLAVPPYDGEPKLEPIAGTRLQYVMNSATPIIRVDDNAFYACQGGVWFVGLGLRGPWRVATCVPTAIYSIPPSSSLYYVTFVKIDRHDANEVWVSYTAGYSGAYVSGDGVVIYGTGYHYTPWIGTIYVSAPVTYGYGVSPCWTPWAGWAYGFAAGWAWSASYSYWCACPPAPYWGPYGYYCYGSAYNAYGGVTAWGPYGWAGTSGTVYHQSGSWSGATRGAAGYNAWTGNQWATEYGRAYNSSTGARAVGQRGAVENVYTGNYAYGERGAAYNPNTGAAAAGGRVTVGNASTGDTATLGRAAVYNPNTGQTTRVGGIQTENGTVGHIGNDVYASKDGNVYRADGRGGWNEVTRPASPSQAPATSSEVNHAAAKSSPTSGSFNRGTTATAQPSSFSNQNSRQGLQGDFQARQLGERRAQSFQANRPQFGGGGLSSRGGFARRGSTGSAEGVTMKRGQCSRGEGGH
ncbi:MAG: autotransporter [Verrucomicrobiota bacterium]